MGRRVAAEFVGTAFLLIAVVGSGIMGERLASGNVAIALFANSIASGAALTILIMTLRPISGAHFNPVVTLALRFHSRRSWPEAFTYILAQVAGALAGVGVAHLMFGLPLFFASTHSRSGPAQLLSEAVATFGLLLVILECARTCSGNVPWAVGGYITAAYWFTSSTSFANPAVTLARAASNTFAGIRPVDAPTFILAQILGAATATAFVCWLVPGARDAGGVVRLAAVPATALPNSRT